jgi:hypothetical protein
LTITSGTSGTGNGEVQYSAAATTGPGRSATLTIAGRTFTLNQGEGCTATLPSTGTTIGDDGGQGSFVVQISNGCAWSAESTVPWITIVPPASGSGEGQVRFSVAANSGPSRSGAIRAAGQTFTVQQGTGCSFAVSSTSQTVPGAGGSGSVNVTAAGGCSWIATSNATWLSVTSGGSGVGNGAVGFSAAANGGSGRSGTLTIAGHTVTVTQGESCTFSVAPEQSSMAIDGGTVTVAVTAPGGCAWTASSATSWMRVTQGATGSGNGNVTLTIERNTGDARSAAASIAGRTVTVNQAGSCSFRLNPASQTVGASQATLSVEVIGSASCTWRAETATSWLTVVSGGTGQGNGTVRLEVQANTGAARQGSVTIGDQVFAVSQDTGCTFTVAPESVAAPAAGRSARVDVTTVASCSWTAVSSASWVTVSTGSGTGDGHTELSVSANNGPARSAGVTVAGRTVTVAQDSGCTYALSSPSWPSPAGGGNSTVNVSAGPGCTWTAASGASWIAITAGTSGSSDGAVQFTVEANTTGAPRAGTIAIAGLTFTVNQQ